MRSRFMALGIVVALIPLTGSNGVHAQDEDSSSTWPMAWKPKTPYLDIVKNERDSVERVYDVEVYRRKGKVIAVSYRSGAREFSMYVVDPEDSVAVQSERTDKSRANELLQVVDKLREAFAADSARMDGLALVEEFRPITNREGEVFLAPGYKYVYVIDTSAGTEKDSVRVVPFDSVGAGGANQKEDVSVKSQPPRGWWHYMDSEYHDDPMFWRGPTIGVIYKLDDPSYHQQSADLSPSDADTVGIGLVRGKIVELGTSEPIKGVSVVLVGTAKIAMTGSDGKWVLERVQAGQYELILSADGYRTERVPEVPVQKGCGTYIPLVLGR